MGVVLVVFTIPEAVDLSLYVIVGRSTGAASRRRRREVSSARSVVSPSERRTDRRSIHDQPARHSQVARWSTVGSERSGTTGLHPVLPREDRHLVGQRHATCVQQIRSVHPAAESSPSALILRSNPEVAAHIVVGDGDSDGQRARAKDDDSKPCQQASQHSPRSSVTPPGPDLQERVCRQSTPVGARVNALARRRGAASKDALHHKVEAVEQRLRE